jgi:hypothetical protein
MNRRPTSRRSVRKGDVVARVAVLIGLATAAGLLAREGASDSNEIAMACNASAHSPRAAL